MRENARLRALGEGLTPAEHVNAILDELLNYGTTEADDVREVLADLLTNARAENKRLRAENDAAQRLVIRVTVLARSLLASPEAVLEHLDQLPDDEKPGALIAADGQADVAELLAAGWTLDDRVDYVAGKRIRFLRPPLVDELLTQQQDGGEAR